MEDYKEEKQRLQYFIGTQNHHLQGSKLRLTGRQCDEK